MKTETVSPLSLLAYTVLDILAHRFAPPFFAVNDDVAIRNFKNQ